MRPGLSKSDDLIAVGHRTSEDLVRRMRHGAVRGVTVIVPIDVALAHRRARIVFEDRTDRIAENRQVGTDDQPALAVEQCRIEILLFPDEGRHRGALDQRFHLALRRPQSAAHDFQGDRIAAALSRCGGKIDLSVVVQLSSSGGGDGTDSTGSVVCTT